MKIHYEKLADQLTITLKENAEFGKDEVLDNGRVCLTYSPHGDLIAIEIGEASKQGDLVVNHCNIPVSSEKIA